MRVQCVIVICLASLVIGFVGGCASSSSGSSSLSADKVNQIHKGVTTKAEVVAMFGPPENVAMLPGGKRVMNYYFMQTEMHDDPQAFVPVVNMFAAKAEGQTNRRTLQVNLDANDVVEDFQYSDDTSKTEMTGGFLGNSSKSTPVTNPSSGN
jgi:hypothetical protein